MSSDVVHVTDGKSFGQGRLLTTEEVADYLRIPVQTIHYWRHFGRAPRAIRVGRHLRFRMNDLLDWVEERAG